MTTAQEKLYRVQHATHVYIGRKACGCCVAITTDSGDKETAKSVVKFIQEGLAVNRIEWQTYKEQVSVEPTFMACPLTSNKCCCKTQFP